VPGENKFGEVSGFPMEESMYFNDGKVGADGSPQKPVIKWSFVEKCAIIAFLLKSVDESADKDGLSCFDDWFGLNGKGADKTDKGELVKARDTVISECENFLATLDSDDRYDRVVEEIDRFIEGGTDYDSTCVIGSSYHTSRYDSYSYKTNIAVNNTRIFGTANTLLRFFEFVIDDDDYDGNKRRLLKHIARKWNIANNVFSGVENGVKELSLIKKERDEAKVSGKPYADVVEILAGLDTREKAVWKQLKEFDISNPNMNVKPLTWSKVLGKKPAILR
jgi:hypothetical protein